MGKQQISGFEAEIWSSNDDYNIYAAAGNLKECKIYMKVLIDQGASDSDYYILSGQHQIVWDSSVGDWVVKDV